MANMSYCRFQNTLSDLRDCVEALEELDEALQLDPEEAVFLSEDEEDAAAIMEKICVKYLELRENIKNSMQSSEEE